MCVCVCVGSMTSHFTFQVLRSIACVVGVSERWDGDQKAQLLR